MLSLYNNLSTSLGMVIKSLNTAQTCTFKLSSWNKKHKGSENLRDESNNGAAISPGSKIFVMF